MNLWNKLKAWFSRKPKQEVSEQQEIVIEEEIVEQPVKPVIIRKAIHVVCPQMTQEEYIEKMQAEPNWMPGWEMIDEELGQLYEDQKPERLDMNLLSKVNRGSGKQLDSYSFYTSDNGYKHLISYGMSELYAKESAYGQEKSKWGYEMTMKLAEERTMDAMWATNIMANLARYTFHSQEVLEEGMLISGDGTPLKPHTESKITDLIVVEDEELPKLETLNGTVRFFQLVGITKQESGWLKTHSDRTEEFLSQMKEENPMLVTDLKRVENCKVIEMIEDEDYNNENGSSNSKEEVS